MNKFQQYGYEFGGAGFTQKIIVKALLDLTSNKFATEISADLRSDLNQGLALRYAENHAELNQGYIQQGENFIAVDDNAFKAHKGAKYQMNVPNLLSIDKTEISKMAQLDKPRWNLVNKPRTKAMAYLSDTVKDMQRLGKSLIAEASGGAPRKANLNFAEAVVEMLFDSKKGLMKKAITAKAGSDSSYNEEQFNESMKAFKNVWLDKKWAKPKA